MSRPPRRKKDHPMTTLTRRRLGITAVTLFWHIAPHPTPDAAGFARWSARASRAIAGGRVGWLA